VEIKILVANRVNQKKLIAEHGIAFWIKKLYRLSGAEIFT